jgi:AcrR family transcriptional regulator
VERRSSGGYDGVDFFDPLREPGGPWFDRAPDAGPEAVMEKHTNFKSMTKNLRKQMIIDTAINVFHQKGYRTATLDDVAHELDLSKAALYHYVSSKEDLLSLIYLQALESYFASAYEIDEMDLAPPEKLRFLIQHHIQDIIIDNLPMFAVFFSEENQLPKKQFERIREGKRKYTRIVQKIITEGVEQGFFRPLDPKLHAFALIGMCNWLYKWYDPGRGANSPEEIAAHFIDLLENGYLLGGRPQGAARAGKAGPGGKRAPRGKKQIMEELKEKAREIAGLLAEMEKRD